MALETAGERRAEVVYLQHPPRKHGGIRISHSAYEIRERETVRTVIRKGSGLVVEDWTI